MPLLSPGLLPHVPVPSGASPGGAGDSYMHLVTLSIWLVLGSAFSSISKLE